MRIRTVTFAMLAMVLAFASDMAAQTTGRIETRTRLVSLFSGLQNQWLDAIKKKDSGVLDRLLSDDFEVWTPAHNGPIPREDWQSQAFADDVKNFRVSDMAVKSPRDGVAIESFRLKMTASHNGSDVMQEFFIVNLWTQEKDAWTCTDSYVSPISVPPSDTPAKPTGKD